jgi:signal transduction histidine kinase
MVPEVSPGEISRHKCLIYDGHPSEQLPVIVPLLREGLLENRRCLYLGDAETILMVQTALAAKGVDVARELQRTALVFSSDRSHLKDGGFDPRAMVGMLRALVDEAVRDGFQGLCATGDMMWELGTEANFGRLLEYEALLEKVFQEKPLMGVCQYHRDSLPARAVGDALLTHRAVHLGASLNERNLFYMPPDLILENLNETSREKQGEWMCRQIVRILQAEQKRDQALASLRESEAEQRRLAAELAGMNRDLDLRVRERTAQLEAINQDLEAFARTVSHDLRAPLRAIDGFSRALEEDFAQSLTAEGRKCLDRVRVSSRLMSDMIDDIMSLSRVTRQDMRRELVPLSALAKQIAGELKGDFPGRDVEFVAEDGLAAWGDPGLLRIALHNLLGNAWKYTSRRPRARIQFGARAGDIPPEGPIYFVRDNGAGFDMLYAHKLFSPFQRLHSGEEFEGTGVGLSTVERIVHRHGGRIWAEGAPGQGAVFYFTLAARPADRTHP